MTLHFAELQPSLVRALRFCDGLFGLFFEQLGILVSMHNWWGGVPPVHFVGSC
jgi:hypothetical protein